MGSALTKDEKEFGSAVPLPGGGKGRAMVGNTDKLAFPEGVYAELIGDKSSSAKELLAKTPVGVARLFHSKRATDLYIDIRDDIIATCQVPKGKNILVKYDLWDSRKINDVINKYKPALKEKGLQVHFNQHSLWFDFSGKGSFRPQHVRWVAFADATIDPKSCTQYVYDPYKIYDPPGPKPKGLCSCESYNKENMKLVEAGQTHFPEAKYVPPATLAKTAA